MTKAKRLFEREQATEKISSLLQATRNGAGSVLFITGASGIGKTELVHRAQDLATAEGFMILRARGSETERDFAYGMVRQLFEPALANASSHERARWFSGAASLAQPLVDPSFSAQTNGPLPASTSDPAFPVLHGLYWLCDNLARECPLLISVDDVQWADQASVRFLIYLARRLEGLPILVAVAARASEESAGLLSQLESDLPVETCLPDALSAEATAAMLRSAIGDGNDSFFGACHASTGGNPFLVTELISALRSAGVNPVDASPSVVSRMGPPGVAKSILLRVKSASHEAPVLAGAVALLGDGADLRRAAELSGLDIGAAGAAADALVAAEILRDTRPLEFVHPLVRHAIYAGLSPSERAFAHGRAARLLAEDGEPVERISTHLLEAEPNGDRWVVKTLRQAAGESLSRGAAGAAIAFLRRAVREPPSPAERPQVLLELGRAEQRVAPVKAVEHLTEAFGLQDDPQARARTGLELLRALFNAGRVAEAVEVVDRSLQGLGDANPGLAMQLEAELVSLLRLGIATSPLADKRLERWKGKLEGRTPPERVLLVHLAIVSALSGADAATVADLAEKSLGGNKLLAEQSCESNLAYISLYPLLCADRYDVVEVFLKASFIQARELGSGLGFALSSGWRSFLLNAKGDVREAEADGLVAFEFALSSPAIPPAILAGTLEGLIPALIEQGEFDRAEGILRRCSFDAELPDAVPFRFLLASRGYLRLAEGKDELGLKDFTELMAREERTGPTNLFLTPYKSLAAIAASRMGRWHRAMDLAQEALIKARSLGAPRALGNALRFAGMVQPGQAGLDLLYEAVEVLEPSPARLVYASALTDLGSELARMGRHKEGMEKLRAGLDLAHRCSATRLEQRAHGKLVALGARPRRPAIAGEESLTASESRICRMAFDGLSNRDIAEALFVTIRTVEQHLTHGYQKLGIHSRDGLRHVLRSAQSTV
ncbi:MAG: AAA family ATPase [Actinomycetota bacterium]